MYLSAPLIFNCMKKKGEGKKKSHPEIEYVLELHFKILIVTVDRRVFE